jgi:hypothetical protein
MAYTLIAQKITQADIGTKYHVGIGITDPVAGLIMYGYCLVQGTKFTQRINTRDRDQIINASAQITDRDLVTVPRITQGDASKGILQTTFIDPARVWDTDLDLKTPGYIQLRPAWARVTKGLTPGAVRQILAFAGDFAYTFAESNGNVYLANAGTSSSAAGGAVLSLDTDGQFLYAGTAAALWRTGQNFAGGWTQLVNGVNGTPRQWWVMNQGSGGYKAYYVTGDQTLYFHDLTQAFPQGAGAAVLVGGVNDAVHITDIVEYQNGIAILTNDIANPTLGTGFDVWYFDGANTTRILRYEGYQAHGLCVCLGDLYVSSHASTRRSTPVLARVTTGTYTPVVEPGVPGNYTALQEALQPRSSSRYVYWPLIAASLQSDTTKAANFIVQYDVITGAVTRLPVLDNLDFSGAAGASLDFGLRQVAAIGASAALIFSSGSTGYVQYQRGAFEDVVIFQTAGLFVTSRSDFNTPGIVKQFRRVTLHHAPLRTGESISVEAHIDQDPAVYTTALAPSPAGATVLNNTVGSIVTVLNLPQASLGHAMYRVWRVNGPNTGATTPTIFYETIEMTTGWTWEMTLECTNRRKNLNVTGSGEGGDDVYDQGLRGKDLYFLLNNGYENAQPVTLWHPNGQVFTATMDDFQADMENPALGRQAVDHDPLDFDSHVRVVLKQTLE